jgi:hypothetical protein
VGGVYRRYVRYTDSLELETITLLGGTHTRVWQSASKTVRPVAAGDAA